MRSPNNTEAWIGAGGAIVGALITSAITLVPWAWSSPDPTIQLRKDIAAGLRGLEEISAPDHRLRQIKKLETLLELDPAFYYKTILTRHSQEIKQQIKSAEQADLEMRLAEEKDRKRIEELERAKLAAVVQAEQERLTRALAEAKAAAEAERDERLRRESEAREAAQKEERRSAILREQEQLDRKKRIHELQLQLENEKVCRNDNCSAWIIR